jgi:hypothetical protein
VSRVRSRSQGHGSTPFTRALYPPGGERLGEEPTKSTYQQVVCFIQKSHFAATRDKVGLAEVSSSR